MKPQSDALILQTGDTQSLPFWKDKSWKHYPFAYQGAEEHFTLPSAIGWHPGYESQSWDIEAYVKAKESGKTYTFVHIYSYNAMGKLFGFSCRVLNVADIAEKKRYVDRRYHFRPLPSLYKPPFAITEGNLDITYHPRGGSVDRWYPKKDPAGNLLPFEYHLEASSNAKSGAQTKLSVDLEALKPPLLDGGMDYRGTLTMFGQPNTFAFCLSPRVKVRGTLEIAGKTEHIEGVGKVGLAVGAQTVRQPQQTHKENQAPVSGWKPQQRLGSWPLETIRYPEVQSAFAFLRRLCALRGQYHGDDQQLHLRAHKLLSESSVAQRSRAHIPHRSQE